MMLKHLLSYTQLFNWGTFKTVTLAVQAREHLAT